MKSLEAKMKKELDLTMAIILNWRPISKKIATYIEKDYECRINDKKDY